MPRLSVWGSGYARDQMEETAIRIPTEIRGSMEMIEGITEMGSEGRGF
jgi:hypothetical protein